jgi:GT2 family glycosyltransferase
VTPEVSAVVVSHRSARECGACVESLREAFARESVAGEIVLVDCASGAAEVEALSRLSADVFLPLAENRGYSGGVNAGLARARGRRIVLCNADVVFLSGALTALLATLEDPGVGAAAPLALWDADGRLLLPPGDPPGFLSELHRLCAGRVPWLDTRRFGAYARETLRLWRSGGAARHLVGAVLAARRDVFDRVGRLDERFPFEHEETEWEDRVRRAGLELRFVPAARIRHLWAVSASRNPESATLREASRRRYRVLAYGRIGRRVLEWVGTRGPARVRAATLSQPAVPARPGAWVALSPNPSGFPFAGTPLDADFSLPAEIAHRLPAGPLYLSVFREEDGRPLERFVWEKAA